MKLPLAKMPAAKSILALWWACLMTVVACDAAFAHATNQAFVPLLPTDFYIGAGVAAVALTVVLLAIPMFGNILSSVPAMPIMKAVGNNFDTLTSVGSLLLLIFLIIVGNTGSTDPLVNPLPLYIWTIFWVGLVSLHAVLGNLWHWINPWTGVYDVFRWTTNWQPLLQFPDSLRVWPAILSLLVFTIFMLASLTPEDPSHLAAVVTGYLVFNFVGMLFFGKDVWLRNCECFTQLTYNFSRMSIIGISDGRLRIGVPGWKLKKEQYVSISAGLFVVVAFASSSFDGLNETFWWLGLLGVNPLEFPGRSYIFWQTVGGLIGFNLAMIAAFSACIFIGLKLVDATHLFREAFYKLAICVIPIAIAYHMAHFLTMFIVNIQYALAAASDPWSDGSDYLGLGTFYVTTGFFNSLEDVRVIFLTQVSMIVTGHLFSIVSAHNAALVLLQTHKKALVSQLPLALFMVGYTFFGLWLLAAPRGA